MSSYSNSSKSFKLDIFKEIKDSDRRYLVCHKCYGYYPLKENELPGDFVECECGNDLEFYENIDLTKIKSLKNPDAEIDNLEILYDDYDELQEIMKIFENKSKKRKELFKSLLTRIEIQEEILNDIIDRKWKLWNFIKEKSLYKDINGQKFIVENIIEQEDTFLSYIKEQRSKVGNTEKKYYTHHFVKIGAIPIVLIIVLEIFIWI